MMKFEFQYDKNYPKVSLIIKDKDVLLPDVLEQFDGFLIACGYVPKGHLEIVEERTKDE